MIKALIRVAVKRTGFMRRDRGTGVGGGEDHSARWLDGLFINAVLLGS